MASLLWLTPIISLITLLQGTFIDYKKVISIIKNKYPLKKLKTVTN